MWQRQNRISKTLSQEEAQYKAAAYCSLAEHCPKEVIDKLLQWGAAKSDVEHIVDWLIDENYLNEERYCRAFVNDKIRYQGWGKGKVYQELSAKRLSTTAIHQAIEDFPENEYLVILQRIADRKRESLHEEDERKAHDKLVRFLLSRGFHYSDIHQLGIACEE